MRTRRPPIVRQHHGYGWPHARKCETCDRIFNATAADSYNQQFRCQKCRTEPERGTETVSRVREKAAIIIRTMKRQ